MLTTVNMLGGQRSLKLVSPKGWRRAARGRFLGPSRPDEFSDLSREGTSYLLGPGTRRPGTIQSVTVTAIARCAGRNTSSPGRSSGSAAAATANRYVNLDANRSRPRDFGARPRFQAELPGASYSDIPPETITQNGLTARPPA